MRVDFVADRTYRRTEPVRWRGRKIGTVVGFKDPMDGVATATVEVADFTLKDMRKSDATRFILERGNVVEVYTR